MALKALDLFQAYTENKLPREGGFIASSFFDRTSAYSIYELVAYSSVKSIYLGADGLTFQTDGNKIFILVEPATYPRKHIEPFRRDTKERVPHRFEETEILITKNQYKIMISKDPVMTYSSFTISRPTGINFSLCFYNREDVKKTLEFFFLQTLNKEAQIPQLDAKKASKIIVKRLEKFTVWKS